MTRNSVARPLAQAPSAQHVVGPRAYAPITVAVGDVLAVRLVDATAGGFVWKVTELPLHLEARDKGHQDTGDPGAAAFTVLRFRAVAPGCGWLVFALALPWEGHPVRQIRLRVTVQEPMSARR